jgi:GNAT superfamily N-acetyltransferase
MLTDASPAYRRDLGNGLILRWSTPEDTEHIAQLASIVFRSKETEPPNQRLADEIRRLMRGDNPLMGPHDYGVIEDTTKEGNPLVACTCLWRHDWEYEGVPFSVGRPEIVATDPSYRHRGLIRALFEMVHARCKSEGLLVQAITGISYFYRQFGYEYALDLGGKRVTYLPLIPKLKDGESEQYTLRDATVQDISALQQCYNQLRSTSIVWATIPDYFWQYHIESWQTHPEKGWTINIQMIADSNGAVQGYVTLASRRWGRDLVVWDMQTAPGSNVQAMMPSVLRALHSYGLQLPTSKPDVEALSEISFILGRAHPIYDALGNELAPFYEPPYAWYIRVQDLPAFIRVIAPVLEKRLAHSVVAGYSGELKLDFYKGGLHMVFEQGRLTSVAPWRVPVYDSNAGAGFAPLVFLQLLFGYRSLDELRHAFPEVWANNETTTLLKALFPNRPSYVHPLSY